MLRAPPVKFTGPPRPRRQIPPARSGPPAARRQKRQFPAGPVKTTSGSGPYYPGMRPITVRTEARLRLHMYNGYTTTMRTLASTRSLLMPVASASLRGNGAASTPKRWV